MADINGWAKIEVVEIEVGLIRCRTNDSNYVTHQVKFTMRLRGQVYWGNYCRECAARFQAIADRIEGK